MRTRSTSLRLQKDGDRRMHCNLSEDNLARTGAPHCLGQEVRRGFIRPCYPCFAVSLLVWIPFLWQCAL
ncbi:hypothetical protein SCLCIDRAFT_1223600 [Scleroderma citrinum Foug A]|uniref:Uncharacterized protein n=1 Tax=Scleroderma citrinum Foug A TaxID=1036808 RepID=A0A0C2ZIM2_9AGAM|nr:hypothetical protein SCLCIDRAFT_1223600 [Scleroderma citrinum Foug A]